MVAVTDDPTVKPVGKVIVIVSAVVELNHSLTRGSEPLFTKLYLLLFQGA
jgi:hypothetical protein